jgi:hypothetical protein
VVVEEPVVVVAAVAGAAVVVEEAVVESDKSELIEVGYRAAEIATLPMAECLDLLSDSYFVRPTFG